MIEAKESSQKCTTRSETR